VPWYAHVTQCCDVFYHLWFIIYHLKAQGSFEILTLVSRNIIEGGLLILDGCNP
jgi:hypothetical protein